jgi:methyl-accepting chemotaxis protein
MLKFNIKTKILTAFILLAAVPILITSVVIDNRANSAATRAIEDQVRNQLISLREIKKNQVEDYFARLAKTIKSVSLDRITINTTRAFNNNFDAAATGADAAQRSEVAAFYNGDYSKQFSERNGEAPQNLQAMLERLDDAAVAMQHTFIAANGNPIGKKFDLLDPDNDTEYGTEHGDRHPSMLRNLDRFGLSDIFIVNMNGRIVYSAQKNIDFGTSLTDGPFKDSLLAQVVSQALKADNYDAVVQSDFGTYAPAYNDPVAFVASPIQDVEDYDSSEFLGAIVFQIPVTGLNAIMTSEQKWTDIGLGDTGEAFLLGKDGIMRSTSREVVEAPDAFAEKLAAAGVPAATRSVVRAKGDTSGIVAAKSAIADAALSGEAGILTEKNFLGAHVLAAHAPINVPGLDWAIISAIDTDEAFAAQNELAGTIRIAAIIVAVVMIALASAVGFVFANTLTRPLRRLANTVTEIEEHADLTQRIKIDSNDEIGQMGGALNRLLGKIHQSMTEFAASTAQVATAAEQMTAITDETRNGTTQQFDQIDQVATAINEMTATVQEVARNAADAAEGAQAADEQANEGNRVVKATVSTIQALSEEMQQATEVIEHLNKESENIGAVMDVIRKIAEQTNLLALNAAIEAARAGEQGRGFAVVADEVRTLAGRTQESTGEIEQMIEKLQSGTRDAVSVMEKGREKSQLSVEQAANAGEALERITRSVNTINQMNTMIASAANEQSSVTEEINRNVVSISQVAEQTTEGAAQTSNASSELSQLAIRLQQLVAQFKT